MVRFTQGRCKDSWEHGLKEHKDACSKGHTENLPSPSTRRISNTLSVGRTQVLDKTTRPVQLLAKEALCIQRTPANNRLNRDGGYELPSCWIATEEIRGWGQRRPHSGFRPRACACTSLAPTKFQHFRTLLHLCPEDD